MKNKKKILILMSKTGNGHLSVAESLKEAFEYTDKDKYEVKIVDGLQEYSSKLMKNISKSYVPIVKYVPSLFTSGYYFTDNEIRQSLFLSLIRLHSKEKITKLVDNFKPDLIISVHPLLNHITGEIAKSKNIPFVVYITDMYHVHESWFNRKADLYLVSNKYIAKQCRMHGIKNISIHPIPVKLKFFKDIDKDKIRKKYNIDKNKYTLLVTFGGGGTVSPIKLLKDLMKKNMGDRYQVIVINGKNKKTYKDVEKLKELNKKNSLKIVNLEFIDNMEEIMSISDISICKAGSTTVQELFTMSVVPIIVNYVRGQEKTCSDFVKLKRAGIVNKRKVIESIENITKNPKRLDRYRKNGERLVEKNSSLKAINEMLQLIK